MLQLNTKLRSEFIGWLMVINPILCVIGRAIKVLLYKKVPVVVIFFFVFETPLAYILTYIEHVKRLRCNRYRLSYDTRFYCQFCKGSLMKVHYPKLYNMAHLLALTILLLPKDLTIMFICYYCSWCCAVWRP